MLSLWPVILFTQSFFRLLNGTDSSQGIESSFYEETHKRTTKTVPLPHCDRKSNRMSNRKSPELKLFPAMFKYECLVRLLAYVFMAV